MALSVIEPEIMRICKSVAGVRVVYDFDRRRLEMVPAITFQYDGFAQAVRSHLTTNVTYRWTLRLYVKQRDEKSTNDTMKQIAEDLMQAFRNDLDLGQTCFGSMLTDGQVMGLEDNDGSYLLHTFTLEATAPKDATA